MRHLLSFLLVCLLHGTLQAQPATYTTANAHAHNDYEKPFPVWDAYRHQLGSIEVDIFLHNGELLVAHEPAQLASRRSLENLYLRPLDSMLALHGGWVYSDSSRRLQLMIDIKTAAAPTLQMLVQTLERYPALTRNGSVQIVISGNRPQPEQWAAYPDFIQFDGELQQNYPAAALGRIVMLSDNFKRYSSWNGKGRIPEAERTAIVKAISKAHAMGKKVRFWNAPDALNSWYGFMDLGVDYINTDLVGEISRFFEQLPARTYTNATPYTLYQPRYRNDGSTGKVRNVILLIGDGMGMAQLYAAYTANRGALNIFNMRNTGWSKTSSYDNYITDSAPGSTALASGVKTNNRAVGVDHTGKALTLLPQIFRKKGMRTGIITCGDMTDATPADFYAHQPERSSSEPILRDLLAEPVDLIMGKPAPRISDTLQARVAKTFQVVPAVLQLPQTVKFPLMVADTLAGMPYSKGRGPWLQQAFARSLELLAAQNSGFFLMAEGAQIDHGAHANQLPWMVTEVLDFDQVVAQAMAFADKDGETLVVVTADHETGGLTLHAGDYTKGFVSGQFATDDHTAAPVPVFAYGPGAHLFTGVYENTAIFEKILKAVDAVARYANKKK